jgi:hypothetical protein
MKNRIKKVVAVLLGIVLTGSVFVSPVKADQPFMRAARNDCNKALGFLRRATADKGGHRNNAMNLTNRAVSEINQGIAYDRRNDSEGDLDPNALIPPDQPNMQKAKDWLKSARENLEKATADKGGHRAAALRLVNDAIDEVQRGIDYDRRN